MQYIDIRDSQVKFVNQEKNPVKTIEDENAELIFQNALQDMGIIQLKDENAELMLRLARLEAK